MAREIDRRCGPRPQLHGHFCSSELQNQTDATSKDDLPRATVGLRDAAARGDSHLGRRESAVGDRDRGARWARAQHDDIDAYAHQGPANARYLAQDDLHASIFWRPSGSSEPWVRPVGERRSPASSY